MCVIFKKQKKIAPLFCLFIISVEFYHKALGFDVLRRAEDWAELSCGGNFRFSIKSVDGNEAHLCTGYSPILSFTVSDMDSRIANCIQMVRLFFPIPFFS